MLLPGEILTKLVFVRKSAEVIVVTGNEPNLKRKRATWRPHKVTKD